MPSELTDFNRQVYNYLKDKEPENGEPFWIDNYAAMAKEIWGEPENRNTARGNIARCQRGMETLHERGDIDYKYIYYKKCRRSLMVTLPLPAQEPIPQQDKPPNIRTPPHKPHMMNGTSLTSHH